MGALTLGACGSGDGKTGDEENNEGPTAFLPLYTSGSRLEAITVGEPESSARHFVSWYDTELKTECSFRYAEDGRLRCLPPDSSLAKGFADAACTEAVYYDARVRPCATPSPYRHEPLEGDRCGTRVIRLEKVSPENVYHETCAETPETLPEGSTVWRDAGAMEPTVFVAGTEHERLNEAGFGVLEIRGEDGSRQVRSILDGTYGACSPRAVVGGDERCVAALGFVENWWYSDEGCSEKPLAYSVRSACLTTWENENEIVLGLDYTGGNYHEPELVVIGPPLEEGTVYEDSFTTQMCEAQDVRDVTWALHPVLEPFDPAELFLVSRTTHGEGRIQRRHNAIGDVLLTPIAGAELFDTELDTPCRAQRTAAGGWVCVPEGAESVHAMYYADPDCTEVVVDPFVDDAQVILHVERNGCVSEHLGEVVIAAYEPVETYSGESFYRRNDEGACEDLNWENTGGYWRLRPIELAELEERRE